MKLSLSLVAVKKITSKVPRSKFLDSELELAAHLILEAEGVINPIVVCRKSINSYEVIAGDFEYYAAVKAREVNPRKGEMIGAFIIGDENEKVLKEQVELLRKSINSGASTTSSVSASKEYETLIKNMIESRLTKTESWLEERLLKLEDELKETKNNLPQQLVPLDAFNSLSMAELILRLKSAGLTDKAATQIAKSVVRERSHKQFASLSDVVARIKITSGKRQIKAISAEKMLAIIDSWSKLWFL
ncbi:MAG: hypothetical protein F6K58_27110 [Symploca sp. SIO2E9]|nr:hypothetical protein [Symploca sp. SIO2E9]